VTLRLPLIYTDKYSTYRAVLQSEGANVRTWDAVKPADGETGKEILLKVQARILRPQTYDIKLGGIDSKGELHDISTYRFLVERRN